MEENFKVSPRFAESGKWKTKEMLIDFRKAPTVIQDLFIDGVKVERVTEYKYLGTVLDNKLNFNKNTDFIHKRCQPRIFFRVS